MKRIAFLVSLLALTLALAAANAVSYSKVYGRTTARLRVRASASASAAVTDNLVPGACVYVTDSASSGGTLFVKIRYRAADGTEQTGWSAQKTGGKTYVEILSAAGAKKAFGVSGGKLPSKKAGTFSAAARKAALSSASSSSSSSSSSPSASASSGSGLSAAQVKEMQTRLKALGFYSGSVTGHIGSRTTAAIRAFQKKHGLTADGVPGKKTLAKLAAVWQAKSGSSGSSSSSSSSASSVPSKGTVYNLDWFAAKNNGIFKALGLYKGCGATLQDLTTGKRLSVRIQSAGNHLDVEPRAKSDTAALCAMYGVSSASQITSKTCWQRRPMLLTTSSGYRFVCSIYGVPHGDQTITDNGFDGQFCLHFLNSKTHSSNRVDGGHQEAIRKAVELVGSGKVKTLKDL